MPKETAINSDVRIVCTLKILNESQPNRFAEKANEKRTGTVWPFTNNNQNKAHEKWSTNGRWVDVKTKSSTEMEPNNIFCVHTIRIMQYVYVQMIKDYFDTRFAQWISEEKEEEALFGHDSGDEA